MVIETGTYQMIDGKIIVVTAILRREVTIKETENGIERTPRTLKDENLIIVFRDVDKHPFPNDLEYMRLKTFRKRVEKKMMPLMKKI